MTDDECAHIIKLAENIYDNSYIVENNTRVLSERRTSESAILRKHRNDTVIVNITNRLVKLLNGTVKPENFEYFQVVKYTNGTFFKTHQDYVNNFINLRKVSLP